MKPPVSALVLTPPAARPKVKQRRRNGGGTEEAKDSNYNPLLARLCRKRPPGGEEEEEESGLLSSTHAWRGGRNLIAHPSDFRSLPPLLLPILLDYCLHPTLRLLLQKSRKGELDLLKKGGSVAA